LIASGKVPLPNTQFRSVDAGDDAVRLSPILLRDHALAATAAGGVALVPLASIDSQPGRGRFRRVAGVGIDTIRFLSEGHDGQALALAGSGVGLAAQDSAAAQWRPE
jgi:hypothetical protein